MRRKLDLTFTALLVPLDEAALLGAALAAYSLRFSKMLTDLRPILQEIRFGTYITSAFFFSLVWLVFFALAGLYSIRPRRAWNELSRILVAGTAGTMVLIASVFFQRDLTTSRFIVLAVWLLAITFVWIERLIVRVVRHTLLAARIGHQRVAVIGRGKTADQLVELYKRNPVLGFTVARQYATWDDSVRADLDRLVRRDRVDEILLADPDMPKEESLDIIAFVEERHVAFKYLADLFAATFTNIEMTTSGGIPVIEVKRTPLDGWGRIFKRLFDVVVSFLLIIITSPIMLLAALLIKLTSKGPVFFSELPGGKPLERVGEGGRPFHYFKFRSMVENAHAMHLDPKFMKEYGNLREGPLMKVIKDPRVTPVGRFIRAWSIDELPELFLVLMGNMSLVGPRPHLPEEVARYKPHQRRVLAIKPGITGMAQISGRADLDFEDEVRLDTWYIENWSPSLDLYILLKTPFVVIRKTGAY
jgi:exopolysaccharide biosynthesis polyprenyl glycosylphosphotransferase